MSDSSAIAEQERHARMPRRARRASHDTDCHIQGWKGLGKLLELFGDDFWRNVGHHSINVPNVSSERTPLSHKELPCCSSKPFSHFRVNRFPGNQDLSSRHQGEMSFFWFFCLLSHFRISYVWRVQCQHLYLFHLSLLLTWSL